MGAESFRFSSGLVTQLDKGLSFTFEPDRRWFSIGRLDVGVVPNNRTLYGLRLQRSGQGLTMGYATLAATPHVASNPFIEWVGNSSVGSGNLSFRTSPSSTNGISTQVALMRGDGTSYFGVDLDELIVPTAGFPKVQIISSASSGVALQVNGLSSFGESRSDDRGTAGIFNQTAGLSRIAIQANSNTSNSIIESRNYGLISLAGGATAENYGVLSSASGISGNNFGVAGFVNGSSTTGTLNYGVYGSATGNGALAGYFNGAVLITGSTLPSDVQLKRDIKREENLLDKIKQLNPVNYYFKQEKEKTGLNLPTELQHGLIAQELELVFPELIREVSNPIFDKDNNQTGVFQIKTVNYTELISVLLGALKELSEEVDNLKSSEITGSANRLGLISDPKLFSLEQNIPNPFSDKTSIAYTLPNTNQNASIFLMNLSGQLIKEYKLNELKGNIVIDGNNLAKGIYIYSLVADNKEILSKKLILN